MMEYKDLEVFKYLSTLEKSDLITITIEQSYEGEGAINKVLLDANFNLNLVKSYSNYLVDPKKDRYEIYDELVTSGMLDKILEKIPESEYNYLKLCLNEAVIQKLDYEKSTVSMISKVINDLPKNAKEAAKLVDGFDKDKYEMVVNLAKSAGMM